MTQHRRALGTGPTAPAAASAPAARSGTAAERAAARGLPVDREQLPVEQGARRTLGTGPGTPAP
ncbi:hypothetical protein ACFVP0_29350 [Streptomyces cinereoruber]|uniref:hypothetical protein n=1 Tax=Streptomyces cinereoruber TaxID=67260 RepID=UPI0036B4FC67